MNGNAAQLSILTAFSEEAFRMRLHSAETASGTNSQASAALLAAVGRNHGVRASRLILIEVEMREDEIKRIDAAINLLKNMKQDINRMNKLSAINCMNLTPKQAQKRNADADWIAMEQIKRRHELHALAVEIGFAERRESYKQIELTDGWHRFNYQPREPQ